MALLVLENISIGQIVVWCALYQGLKIVSTSLMGFRANTLGGIHMHKLFPFPTDNNAFASSFRCAEYALQKINEIQDKKHFFLHWI